MKVKNVLILDDITPLGAFIKREIHSQCSVDITVDLFTAEQEFVKELDGFNPDTTLIMVNAAYNPPEVETYRYKLNGINRILKLGLRITWHKRHPVIVYGTIDEAELISSPLGSIFASSPHHNYLDLTKLNEIDFSDLFESRRCIHNEDLRTIINEHCGSELQRHIAGISHLLGKTHQLKEENWRRKFIEQLERLDRLLFDDQINKARLKAAIRLLKYFEPYNLNALIKRINVIRCELAGFNKEGMEVENNVSP